MAKYLRTYDPPEWVKKLKWIPKYRVELAHRNTPIHEWNIPSVPDGFRVYIKRHDMTGCSLSGNKVLKLEFLLADAIDKGCRHVISCASEPSNHCRTLTLAARQLELVPHLFLDSSAKAVDEVGWEGNMLLNRLGGADIHIIPLRAPAETHVHPKMEALAKKIERDTGEKCYVIPRGGSNIVGLYGPISIFDEMYKQGIGDDYDDLVVTGGSGGTTAGLCIANYLLGSPVRVHCLMVHRTAEYFHNYINKMLEKVGLSDVRSHDIVDVIDGHQGKGYAVHTQEDIDFLIDVSSTTGMLLDPTYTGKAARGMVSELRNNPGRFKGRRVLYLHTGGMFGLFDSSLLSLLKNNPATNRVTMSLEEPPGLGTEKTA